MDRPPAEGERAGDRRPLLREVAEPIAGDVGEVDVGALLERIGDARVVCLGEATHGTSEFYALRAHITKALVRTRGFTIVAAEADWPDAARIQRYVRGLPGAPVPEWRAFARFPQWMWRNHEVLAFVEWLREWNATHAPVGFYGLDLYSLYRSIRLVLDYLDRVDPAAARVARERTAASCRGKAIRRPTGGPSSPAATAPARTRWWPCCVTCWRASSTTPPAMASTSSTRWATRGWSRMPRPTTESCTMAGAPRGTSATGTCSRRSRGCCASTGPDAKAVLWEHNSHLGDAAATEMGVRGELNVGHLCRQAFGDRAYLIGFGTDHGTVAAAHDWDGPMHVMPVRPAPRELRTPVPRRGGPGLLPPAPRSRAPRGP